MIQVRDSNCRTNGMNAVLRWWQIFVSILEGEEKSFFLRLDEEAMRP